MYLSDLYVNYTVPLNIHRTMDLNNPVKTLKMMCLVLPESLQKREAPLGDGHTYVAKFGAATIYTR